MNKNTILNIGIVLGVFAIVMGALMIAESIPKMIYIVVTSLAFAFGYSSISANNYKPNKTEVDAYLESLKPKQYTEEQKATYQKQKNLDHYNKWVEDYKKLKAK